MTRAALVLFAAAILSAPGPSAAEGAPQVTLVSSSDAGVILEYVPGELRMRDAPVGERSYTAVSVGGADLTGTPGAPRLPVARARVAVPDCEGIDFYVSTAGTRRIEDVSVAPVPTYRPTGTAAPGSYRYVEGEAYRGDAPWPDRAARMLGPSWMATQRVVEVEFYPCQAQAARDLLLTHESIEVRLVFRGVNRRDHLLRDSPRRERLLKAALVNYESGKRWRARPATGPVERSDDYFTASDNWAKLLLRERGMYRIGHDDLKSADIDPDDVDPASVRVFSGGSLPVPEDLSEPRPVWMEECEILVEDEGDGVFDEDDSIIFYALGVDGWADEYGTDHEERYLENHFARENVYWLTWEADAASSGFSDSPHRMATDDLQDAEEPELVDSYFAREHYERNIYPEEGLSDNWFWRDLDNTGQSEWGYIHESLNHVITDSTGRIRARMDGGSYQQHHVMCYLNGQLFYDGKWQSYQHVVVEGDGLEVNENYNTFAVYVPRDDPFYPEDFVLVDWFELRYWRELWATGERFSFGSSNRQGVLEYVVGGFEGTSVSVFKIEDKYRVSIVPGVEIVPDGEEQTVVFQDEVGDTAAYFAVSESGYLSPAISVDVPENLREISTAEYIMIVYDDFYDEAVRLKNHRESQSGGSYSVQLVRISDVYDEFSWGLVDPTAIRDFLKYTWEHSDVPPTHAVLIGDASVDPRNYSSVSIPCYIPAHYAYLPYGGTSEKYWPAEPWFVGFEDIDQYLPAMALGRLPARSSSELVDMIDKIERYETESVLGPWKNTAIIVGDDEFTEDTTHEFMHTEDSERLAREILPWSLDRVKIYLMEYEEISDLKPGARDDLIAAWDQGGLILDYSGHGSEIVMAHEQAFRFDDWALLHNIDALPFFFAASCRLNKFDQEREDALGEVLVKSPHGGSIASMGSTRDSGAGYNTALNRRFFSRMFDGQQLMPTAVLDIGMSFQAAFSTGGGAWMNDTRFAILGDPALTLASPSGGGVVDSVGVEPLVKQSIVSLSGVNSGTAESQEGVVLLHVADSADTSGYFHTDPLPERHVEYRLPGETVYSGTVGVNEGEFTDARFVVSRMAEEGPYGRIRAYFYGEDVDGSYSLEDVTIADTVYVADGTGPQIRFRFEGGGTTILPGAVLEMLVTDEESGINLVDRDLGDAIIVSIDDSTNAVNVTDEFVYDHGSYTSGSVVYDLPSLSVGGHALSLAASDNIGNRSKETLSFEIVSSAQFEIRDVANHPNPFSSGSPEGTVILFQLPIAADVRIDVFTVGGRLIKTIDGIRAAAGANEVRWDGLDQQGDKLANGVYLYRIHATSEARRGDKAEAIGRAVVMR